VLLQKRESRFTIHEQDSRSRSKLATMPRSRWHEHDLKVTIHYQDWIQARINIPSFLKPSGSGALDSSTQWLRGSRFELSLVSCVFTSPVAPEQFECFDHHHGFECPGHHWSGFEREVVLPKWVWGGPTAWEKLACPLLYDLRRLACWTTERSGV
jgi:hypothetical protein